MAEKELGNVTVHSHSMCVVEETIKQMVVHSSVKRAKRLAAADLVGAVYAKEATIVTVSKVKKVHNALI